MKLSTRDDWWLLPGALILGWGAWWWLSPADPPYNNAVFQAFRTAEEACMAERDRTLRCARVLDLMTECADRTGGRTCTADEYHQRMLAAGVMLPPLRESPTR